MFARLMLMSLLIVAPVLKGAECESLSLYKGKGEKDKVIIEFYEILKAFHGYSLKADYVSMGKLLHPAIQKKRHEKTEVFKSVFMDYGINKTRLANNQLFKLTRTEDSPEPSAHCDSGLIRMPLGPKTQYVALMSATSNNELVKIMMTFAPILDETRSKAETFKNLGAIYFNIQNWTHLRKNAEHYLKEARRMKAQKLTMASWFMAETARRLNMGNSYFEPELLSEVKDFKADLGAPIAQTADIKSKLEAKVKHWHVMDIAPSFEAKGVQPGFKIVVDQFDSSIKKLKSYCTELKNIVEKQWQELTWEYQGVTCLLYDKRQDIRSPAVHGSVFIKWSPETKNQ